MDPSLLLELDKLKNVTRKSYLTDGSRRENSAEHSWHLATSLLAFQSYLPEAININRAIQMALVHDVCEIGAGDECAYFESQDKAKNERQYLTRLKEKHPQFGELSLVYWQEYENGESLEAQWVKLFDKVLPFLLNVANQGRTWREQGITKPMVKQHNAFIKKIAPDVHAWLIEQLDQAAKEGWIET